MSRWLDPFVAMLGVLLVALLAYLPTAVQLHENWTNMVARSEAHGYLIAAVCIWMLWDRREEIRAAAVRPALAMLAGSLILGVAWLIVYRANIQILHMMLLPPIMLAAVWAALGWQVARYAALPVGYLYFAIPVWTVINPVLHGLTVWAVTLLLRVTGIPAAIEESFVYLESGTIEIESGCSGLHYFVVGLALAVLYGEANRLSWRGRLRVAALGAGFAMLANWVRIYVIVVLGHWTKMQHYLVAVDHYWFGWGLFAVCIALFFVVARAIRVCAASDRTSVPSVTPAPRRTVPAYFAALACVAAVPALAGYAPHEATVDETIVFPPAREPWAGPRKLISPEWYPQFNGAHATALAEYVGNDGGRVHVFAAAYRVQRQGAELIGHHNPIAGGSGFELQAEHERALADGSVREAVLVRRAVPTAVVWWVYDIGGRDITLPLAAQLWYGVRALRRAPVSAVRVYHAPCAPDCATARTSLHSFRSAMDGAIKAAIGSFE